MDAQLAARQLVRDRVVVTDARYFVLLVALAAVVIVLLAAVVVVLAVQSL